MLSVSISTVASLAAVITRQAGHPSTLGSAVHGLTPLGHMSKCPP